MKASSSHFHSFLLFVLLWFTAPCAVLASPADTARLFVNRQHLTLEQGVTWGKILVVDPYQAQWQVGRHLRSAQFSVRQRTLPSDSCEFAREYGYPEWALTMSWCDASGVRMRKQGLWGLAEPVDYTSHMGQLLGLYGSFSRPLWRNARWLLGYALEEGLAFNTRPYRRADNIDNELTGSSMLIHFGASLYGTYRLASQWSLRADLAFRHVSNGATSRPNKGANWWAPTLSLQYHLTPTASPIKEELSQKGSFHPYWYSTWGLSLGARSLLEEWLRTQYKTPPNSEDYRSEQFRTYFTLNLTADLMRRYARRWASGLGLDLFYLPYVSRLRELDGGLSSPWKHHPWSLGLAAKHEAFYGSLSLYVSLGYYLYRHTGSQQPHDETPYYERIGLRYRMASLRGLSLGLGIKAHRTKADFTELTLAYDL